jgi:hypothetical protein
MIDIDKLTNAAFAKAYVGVVYGPFAIKYGPYTGPQVGEFLRQLMDQHEGEHPFLFSVELPGVANPVPELIELAKDMPKAKAKRGKRS